MLPQTKRKIFIIIAIIVVLVVGYFVFRLFTRQPKILTDQQKYQILNDLGDASAKSTLTEQQKGNLLNNLESSKTAPTSDEQKLKILNSLSQ